MKKFKNRILPLLLAVVMAVGIFAQPMSVFAATYDYPAFDTLVPEGYYWLLCQYKNNGNTMLYVSPTRFLVGQVSGYGEAVGVKVNASGYLMDLDSLGVKRYDIVDGQWVKLENIYRVFCGGAPRSYMTYIGCSNDIQRASDNYIIYKAQALTTVSTGSGIYFADHTEVNNLTARIKQIAEGMMGGVLNMLADPLITIGDLLNYLYNVFLSVRDNLVSGLRSVVDKVGDLNIYFEDFVKQLWADLTDNTMTIKEKIVAVAKDITEPIDKLKTLVTDLKDKLFDKLAELKDGIIEKLRDTINNLIALKDQLSNLGSTIAGAVSGAVGTAVSTAFENIPILKNIKDKIFSLYDELIHLPETLFNKFKELLELLFVPKNGFFDNFYNHIKGKYAFISETETSVNTIMNFFKNTNFSSPPAVTINFGSKQGGVSSWGNQTVTMDMSWYAPYKSSVDVILSGMIVVFFGWHQYMSVQTMFKGVASGGRAIHTVIKQSERGDE